MHKKVYLDFCPGRPDLYKIHDAQHAYTGYDVSTLIPPYESMEFCASQHQGSLPIMKTLEALMDISYVQGNSNFGHVKKNFWLDFTRVLGEKVGGSGECSDLECIGRGHQWADGTFLE